MSGSASILNTPPTQRDLDVVDQQGGKKVATWGKAWSSYWTQVFQILFAVQQSGTTAQRPTTGLWAGRPYFDISLGANGKPIWVRKDLGGWVLADGTAA